MAKHIASISKTGKLNNVAQDAIKALAGENQQLLVSALNGDEAAMKQLIKTIAENGLGKDVTVSTKKEEKPMEAKSESTKLDVSRGIIKIKQVKEEKTGRRILYILFGTGRRVVSMYWDGRAEGPKVTVKGQKFQKKWNESREEFYARISTDGKEKLIAILKENGIRVSFVNGELQETTEELEAMLAAKQLKNKKPAVEAVTAVFGDVEDENNTL